MKVPPDEIKINLMKYHFTTANYLKDQKLYWTKEMDRVFLTSVNKHSFVNIFKEHNYPELNASRQKYLSPFGNIPLVDISILVIFSYFLIRFISSLLIN